MITSVTPPLVFWFVSAVVSWNPPCGVVTVVVLGGAELRVRGQVGGPYVIEPVIDDQVEALDVEAGAVRGRIDSLTVGIFVLQLDVAEVGEQLAADGCVGPDVDAGRTGSRDPGATREDGGGDEESACCTVRRSERVAPAG